MGGAEQIVAQLDRALCAHGHHSFVIAAAGSHAAGQIVSLPAVRLDGGDVTRQRVHRNVRAAIAFVLARHDIDLMHFHGNDFAAYLPAYGPPALISLHLPLGWYDGRALRPTRAQTWLQPVSRYQARTAPADLALLPAIENGVDTDAFPALRKRGYALMLGRVCPEKGFHDAIAAAKLAAVPLLLAGRVFPWPEHQRYFADEVLPQLDAMRRWIGPIADKRKRRLLAAASCVLIPSRVEETSSLVAMEALAAGTPVIAYRSGALSDIVDDGITGYLVDDAKQMAEAIALSPRLDPEACRHVARTRFSAAEMRAAYLALYMRIAAWTRQRKELPRA